MVNHLLGGGGGGGGGWVVEEGVEVVEDESDATLVSFMGSPI